MSSELRRAREATASARRNIARVLEWTSDMTIDALRADTLRRYAVERAFIALDAAVRDIPDDAIRAHDLPVRMIAGFRNILAHTYDDIVDDRIMTTIARDLPLLDARLALIAADLAA